jgi:hypothetical protein
MQFGIRHIEHPGVATSCASGTFSSSGDRLPPVAQIVTVRSTMLELLEYERVAGADVTEKTNGMECLSRVRQPLPAPAISVHCIRRPGRVDALLVLLATGSLMLLEFSSEMSRFVVMDSVGLSLAPSVSFALRAWVCFPSAGGAVVCVVDNSLRMSYTVRVANDFTGFDKRSFVQSPFSQVFFGAPSDVQFLDATFVALADGSGIFVALLGPSVTDTIACSSSNQFNLGKYLVLFRINSDEGTGAPWRLTHSGRIAVPDQTVCVTPLEGSSVLAVGGSLLHSFMISESGDTIIAGPQARSPRCPSWTPYQWQAYCLMQQLCLKYGGIFPEMVARTLDARRNRRALDLPAFKTVFDGTEMLKNLEKYRILESKDTSRLAFRRSSKLWELFNRLEAVCSVDLRMCFPIKVRDDVHVCAVDASTGDIFRVTPVDRGNNFSVAYFDTVPLSATSLLGLGMDDSMTFEWPEFQSKFTSWVSAILSSENCTSTMTNAFDPLAPSLPKRPRVQVGVSADLSALVDNDVLSRALLPKALIVTQADCQRYEQHRSMMRFVHPNVLFIAGVHVSMQHMDHSPACSYAPTCADSLFTIVGLSSPAEKEVIAGPERSEQMEFVRRGAGLLPLPHSSDNLPYQNLSILHELPIRGSISSISSLYAPRSLNSAPYSVTSDTDGNLTLPTKQRADLSKRLVLTIAGSDSVHLLRSGVSPLVVQSAAIPPEWGVPRSVFVAPTSNHSIAVIAVGLESPQHSRTALYVTDSRGQRIAEWRRAVVSVDGHVGLQDNSQADAYASFADFRTLAFSTVPVPGSFPSAESLVVHVHPKGAVLYSVSLQSTGCILTRISDWSSGLRRSFVSAMYCPSDNILCVDMGEGDVCILSVDVNTTVPAQSKLVERGRHSFGVDVAALDMVHGTLVVVTIDHQLHLTHLTLQSSSKRGTVPSASGPANVGPVNVIVDSVSPIPSKNRNASVCSLLVVTNDCNQPQGVVLHVVCGMTDGTTAVMSAENGVWAFVDSSAVFGSASSIVDRHVRLWRNPVKGMPSFILACYGSRSTFLSSSIVRLDPETKSWTSGLLRMSEDVQSLNVLQPSSVVQPMLAVRCSSVGLLSTIMIPQYPSEFSTESIRTGGQILYADAFKVSPGFVKASVKPQAPHGGPANEKISSGAFYPIVVLENPPFFHTASASTPATSTAQAASGSSSSVLKQKGLPGGKAPASASMSSSAISATNTAGTASLSSNSAMSVTAPSADLPSHGVVKPEAAEDDGSVPLSLSGSVSSQDVTMLDREDIPSATQDAGKSMVSGSTAPVANVATAPRSSGMQLPMSSTGLMQAFAPIPDFSNLTPMACVLDSELRMLSSFRDFADSERIVSWARLSPSVLAVATASHHLPASAPVIILSGQATSISSASTTVLSSHPNVLSHIRLLVLSTVPLDNSASSTGDQQSPATSHVPSLVMSDRLAIKIPNCKHSINHLSAFGKSHLVASVGHDLILFLLRLTNATLLLAGRSEGLLPSTVSCVSCFESSIFVGTVNDGLFLVEYDESARTFHIRASSNPSAERGCSFSHANSGLSPTIVSCTAVAANVVCATDVRGTVALLRRDTDILSNQLSPVAVFHPGVPQTLSGSLVADYVAGLSMLMGTSMGSVLKLHALGSERAAMTLRKLTDDAWNLLYPSFGSRSSLCGMSRFTMSRNVVILDALNFVVEDALASRDSRKLDELSVLLQNAGCSWSELREWCQ